MTGREPLVLVVEDEPQVMRFLRATLPTHGYRVLEATNGTQAIVEAETRQPDLVLLDLGLPDLDGLEVLRVLRERGVAVPVIVITSRTDPRDRATALELGVREYLTKPFAWADVWAAVRRCVTAREQA
jgi:two-component system KDP operon response regulator KdpE